MKKENGKNCAARHADVERRIFESQFRKTQRNTTASRNSTRTNPGATDHEFKISLEAAQSTVRTALARGSGFFKNQETAVSVAQAMEFEKLQDDLLGCFEARPVIEAAKKGDRVSRHALHNKLSDDIAGDFPILGEYKKYLMWLLASTRETKGRRGRLPKLNAARDHWIRIAVEMAMTFGFRLTRNRASEHPSAASLVAEALAEFGVPMTEANVELIAKDVKLKRSED
jgi:hypothetical protein